MKTIVLASLAALALAAPAAAATYTSSFATGAATWASNYDGDAPIHYFYFLGANVSQGYTGTGLTSVTTLDVTAPFEQQSLEPLTFTFSINGSDVGSWTIPAATGSGSDTLSYNFGPIAGIGGDGYTIGLRVTGPVCSGCGNVQLNESVPLTITLSDTAGGVPEPANWALLIAGFGLTGAAMRRRRSVAVAA